MVSKRVSSLSFSLCTILLVTGSVFSQSATPPPSPGASLIAGEPNLPEDLVGIADAQYPPTDDLASGSEEAQMHQSQAVEQLGLPLEVKTRQTGIVFRLIPAGTFTMGSPPNEEFRNPLFAEDQHEVLLAHAFYCGKFEVTQGQWQQVMGDNPSHFTSAGQNAPVEGVSWDDCQEFLKRLCQMEGVSEGTYRLLTAAEWEYACRAGTGTPFCYGESLDSSMANFNGNYPYGEGAKGEFRGTTVGVGSFQANGWGLYDMHGNVWEWCEDSYCWNPPGPVSVGTVCARVLRGGAWNSGGWDCRSARFIANSADIKGPDLGLRLARTTQALPADLVGVVDANYAPLTGLASGSQEAQDSQRETVQQLGLPLEVKTRQTGIVLRLVPAGTFTMGSPPSELHRDDGETQHQVTLTKAFYCGKSEVTQGQWQQVIGSNPSYFSGVGQDAPVERVSWDDCQVFLAKLCQKEGVPNGTYRLLTEAEWEYACRAGTVNAYYFGESESVLGEYAWYSGNSGGQTHPVGQETANAFGLHDMHGNVWEWCQDWYGGYGSGAFTDPPGPPSGGVHVARGGAWDNIATYCRSAVRGWIEPTYRSMENGLRLARTAPSYP